MLQTEAAHLTQGMDAELPGLNTIQHTSEYTGWGQRDRRQWRQPLNRAALGPTLKPRLRRPVVCKPCFSNGAAGNAALSEHCFRDHSCHIPARRCKTKSKTTCLPSLTCELQY